MNKFYINYNNGREYYAYKYKNDQVTYTKLSEREIMALLSKIGENRIKKIIDNDKSMEVTFENSFSLVIDNSKIFLMQQNSQDRYFFRLLNKIKRFTESETLKTKRKINHVNRNKSKRIPKAIIAGTLSFSIGVSMLVGIINKEISKSKEVSPGSDITQEINIDVNRNIKENIAFDIPEETEKDATIKLAFEDRTESNRVSEEESKLEETKNYYGTIIFNYSTRYGLPYELACAQITQERPNIKNGVCDNICQITYDLFIGRTLTVPIYNEQGFTGEYETFEVTKEMLDTPDGNIKTGLAYLRICTDKFNSLISGLFSFNQGEYALNLACNYYGLNKEDYYGDENAIKARDLINRYYEEQGKKHGDSTYLENVFSYLYLDERGSVNLEYYLGSEKKTVEIKNTLVYNNELSR